MNLICNTTSKQFTTYTYVPVDWSSDYLPVCPWCQKSPYDSDFEQSHKPVEQRQGGDV